MDRFRQVFTSDLFKIFLANKIRGGENPVLVWRFRVSKVYLSQWEGSEIMGWGREVLMNELGFPHVTFAFHGLDQEWYYLLWDNTRELNPNEWDEYSKTA